MMATLTAASHRAIEDFWENITTENHEVVCSSFSSQSSNILAKLTARQTCISDKRAVTAFLLETGTLQVEIQTVEHGFMSEKIVFTKDGCEDAKHNEVGHGLEKKTVNPPSLNDLKKEAKLKLQNLHVNLTRLKGPDVICSQKYNSNKVSHNENAAIDTLATMASVRWDHSDGESDIDYDPAESDGDYDPAESGGAESASSASSVSDPLDPSPEQDDRGLRKQFEMVEEDHGDDGDVAKNGNDVEDQCLGTRENQGGDSDMVTYKEDEQMVDDGLVEQTVDSGAPCGEKTDYKKVLECQTCRKTFQTTWDYDMHSVYCTVAKNKKKYACHLCKRVRPYAAKWGIAYHLIKRHKFSGAQALAKLPELDVKSVKESRRHTPFSRDDNDDEHEEGAILSKDKDVTEDTLTDEQNSLNGPVRDVAQQSISQTSLEGQDTNDGQNSALSDIPSEKICKICFKGFKSVHQAYSHAKRVHFGDINQHKCSTCGKIIIGADRFKIHVRLHISKGKGITYDCKDCDKVFSTQGALINHSVIHKRGESSFKCHQCYKKFTYKTSLKKHMKTHESTEKKFKCERCDRTYADKLYLQTHMKRHTGIRDCKCEQCDKAFYTERALKTHVRNLHTAPRQFLCDLCGAVYNSLGSLSVHHKFIHDEVKKYLCTRCGRGFARSNMLEDHEKVHTEDWPFQCDICKKAFHLRREFMAHNELMHKGLENLFCAVCDRMFFEKSSLQHHIKHCHERDDVTDQSQEIIKNEALSGTSHSKMNDSVATRSPSCAQRTQYTCEDCNMKFHRKYSYRLHMNQHKGLKTFPCKTCGKNFLSESSRKAHMTNHSGTSTKWPCEKCSRSCKSYRLLREHMKDGHRAWLPRRPRRTHRPLKLKETESEPSSRDALLSGGASRGIPLSSQSSPSPAVIIQNTAEDTITEIAKAINEMTRSDLAHHI